MVLFRPLPTTKNPSNEWMVAVHLSPSTNWMMAIFPWDISPHIQWTPSAHDMPLRSAKGHGISPRNSHHIQMDAKLLNGLKFQLHCPLTNNPFKFIEMIQPLGQHVLHIGLHSINCAFPTPMNISSVHKNSHKPSQFATNRL